MVAGKIKLVLLLFCLAWSSSLFAQIRSGSAFLKMLPGARLQSMGGAATAVMDDPHAIFANPANAAFLREWHWSASYSKWIADISNASFVYGRALPGSPKTRVALGFLYQGVAEFNNDASRYPAASANDFVVSFSVGQPLTFLSQHVSVGGNAKYLSSTLAQYSASTFVYDVGISAKTLPFQLTKSLKSVLTFGTALTQNGRDMTFVHTGTPLPKTFRTGLGMYVGRHDGVQMLFSADYINVQDEDAYFALGGELMINRFLGINAGYNLGSDLFNKLTLGASIRLDNSGICLGSAFPSKDNAFRFDFATLDENEFFSRTYRGTATHFPTRPEPFDLLAPSHGDSVLSSNPVLRWQHARDLDVFDQVKYHVLVDQDSLRIANILSACDENPDMFKSMLQNPLDLNRETVHNFIPMETVRGGDFYWAVVAMDEDEQVRLGQALDGPIARFNVPLPDVNVKNLQFEPHAAITNDAAQGLIRVTISNSGERAANSFKIRLVDQVDELHYTLDALASSNPNALHASNNIIEHVVTNLRPDESRTLEFQWNSPLLGKHKITAEIQTEDMAELNSENNTTEAHFYTIPKGTFSIRDSVATLFTETRILDMPLVTQIFFDSSSAQIKPTYLQKQYIEPILPLLASRLQEHSEMFIELKGFADPNSNERRVELANERALAVRNSLLDLGVDSSQIKIIGGTVLPLKSMPVDTLDSRWILQERRFVNISTLAEFRPVLLRPQRHEDVAVKSSDIRFVSDVSSVLPITHATLHLNVGNTAVQHELKKNSSIDSEIEWRASLEQLDWIGNDINYYITFNDSLGRNFSTPTRSFTLKEDTKLKQHIFSVPLKFGKTDPMAEFYWQEIFDYAQVLLQASDVHLRFEGHACQIGPEDVNQKLSFERAKRFDNEFRAYLATKNDQTASTMLAKIDAPEGLGENNPLSFETEQGLEIIGRSDTPVGRNLNRRIELVLYKNGKRL